MKVEVADTPAKWQKGLMFRDSLAANSGMWFAFPKPAPLRFWMKNVKFPIDIVFISTDYVIGKIWSSVPPCKAEPCPLYDAGFNAMFVIELQAGFCNKNGITEGQKVEYRP